MASTPPLCKFQFGKRGRKRLIMFVDMAITLQRVSTLDHTPRALIRTVSAVAS